MQLLLTNEFFHVHSVRVNSIEYRLLESGTMYSISGLCASGYVCALLVRDMFRLCRLVY